MTMNLRINLLVGLLLCTMVLGFGFTHLQKEDRSVIMIRTFESIGWKSYLVILDGDDILEKVELRNPRRFQIENAKLLSRIIKEYSQKGYKIVEVSSAGTLVEGAIVSTYLLQK